MSLIKQELYLDTIETEEDTLLKLAYQEMMAEQAYRLHQSMIEELDEEATYPIYWIQHLGRISPAEVSYVLSITQSHASPFLLA